MNSMNFVNYTARKKYTEFDKLYIYCFISLEYLSTHITYN